MSTSVYEMMQQAASFIQSRKNTNPTVGVILGSGLGELGSEVEDAVHISYGDIPYFPTSTVVGHAGKLILGTLSGLDVVLLQGRFHFYEGYPLADVVFPVRVMKALGVNTLVVTNAAGGVNTTYQPGDLMIIDDHLNLMMTSPLIGANDTRLGERFPDMSNAYDKGLRQLLRQVAQREKIDVQQGIYAGLTGPSYETPAEIRMLRILGADAVGMSTVPEVIAANHVGMKVAGISCISNMAAGILEQPLSHKEVIETGERVKEKFARLIKEFLRELRLR